MWLQTAQWNTKNIHILEIHNEISACINTIYLKKKKKAINQKKDKIYFQVLIWLHITLMQKKEWRVKLQQRIMGQTHIWLFIPIHPFAFSSEGKTCFWNQKNKKHGYMSGSDFKSISHNENQDCFLYAKMGRNKT